MGTYTEVVINVRIKFEKIEEARREWKKLLEENEKEGKHSWIDYYNDLEIENDGFISFADYYRKFQEYEYFCNFLAKYVYEGDIYLNTEGDKWKIHFDGKGGWQEADFLFEVYSEKEDIDNILYYIIEIINTKYRNISEYNDDFEKELKNLINKYVILNEI